MAVSWQNERTIELAVMMGTMLQDELNAITVGIFLQAESGYMTWLNYRLLDTLIPQWCMWKYSFGSVVYL